MNIFNSTQPKFTNQHKNNNQPLQSNDFIWQYLKKLQNYDQKNQQQYKVYLQQKQVDFALGAMFGAFMGDALGSFLQFRQYPDKQVDTAMKMPGGGVFKLQAGQFTDDSQLASHMLKGLKHYSSSKPFQQQKQQISCKIADQYIKWYYSEPFDIGNTTRTALDILFDKVNPSYVNIVPQFKYDKLESALKQIQHDQCTGHSQSNGSLMRITPMAFFVSFLCKYQFNKPYLGFIQNKFQQFIQNEINMTHGKKIIHQANTAWVSLLVKLILRKSNLNQQKHQQNTLKNIFYSFIKQSQQKQLIKDWISQYKKKQFMPGQIKMGWSKIAFTYGLKHLNKLINKKQQHKMSSQDYHYIIKDVLLQRGDTDTNAAIVGGLIGAVIGFKNLPLELVKKQFQLDLNQKKLSTQRNYHNYQPKRLFLEIMEMITEFKKRKNNSEKIIDLVY